MKHQITYILSFTTAALSAVLVLGAHTGTPEPVCPIGSIIAFHASIAGTHSLPVGWVICSGGNVSDSRSPLNGQPIPNLNGNGQFLRGHGVTSGGTGGAATHAHTYVGTTDFEDGDSSVVTGSSGDSGCQAGTCLAIGGVAALGHVHAFTGDTDAASSLPPYFEVLWIMRIE